MLKHSHIFPFCDNCNLTHVCSWKALISNCNDYQIIYLRTNIAKAEMINSGKFCISLI